MRTLNALSAEHRGRLLHSAREVSFEQGARLFEEGEIPAAFWIIRTGLVTLDIRIPGRRPRVIESLAHGELVGWSWMFPPSPCRTGAEAMTPVRALEFDAAEARRLCEADPWFGHAVSGWVGSVLAHRLQASRARLLDLYASPGVTAPR
ncbi:Crp/Fnr family transcriptional regulator [Streptomyces clavuligerus]|uniref:Regulator protein n=1 Tax=Streptomyces clavuligerus TaxID=1901 RepID=E2Q733_STRCL|nr:cyclic nucleotide-binding domain-containing protein [Streptomyces clavuligerus]ANW21553.1 regulator [Streptomyces clavuligerus]AXU16183.1 Crp/Fnr family transcriptional regulator [Streptomyces clavuligerus]EFG05280.1 regulator protein [Streptomyces clavuligerus]MBY6306333.1 cyclic nucleotide-binding domain-containing protein [Streptomyces clavuligerus]QCS08962.1 Crp/Fnr family transcriptional regulator [Streptomyces clavuligerus]